MATAASRRARLPSPLKLPAPGNSTQLMAAEWLRLPRASLTDGLQPPDSARAAALNARRRRRRARREPESDGAEGRAHGPTGAPPPRGGSWGA